MRNVTAQLFYSVPEYLEY